jgi:hypothetical protein
MPIKLSKIKPNPNNPRVIRDENFKKLISSIDELFKGLYLRPIAVTEDNIIIGGNQRYRALQHLGYKEVPDECVVVAKGWTKEEIDRFIILDNSNHGEWDWDNLANDWDEGLLKMYNVWKAPEEIFAPIDALIDVDPLDFDSDNKPKMTDDGYSLFELVMLHENKLELLDTLNEIKRGLLFEKLEDALMELIRIYKKSN